MIFKIIFTDNKDKIKEFHFVSASIDDADNDLESIFYPSLTTTLKKDGHRVVLFQVKEFDGHNISKLTQHVLEVENSTYLKTWNLSSISLIEEKFLIFQEKNSLTNLLIA